MRSSAEWQADYHALTLYTLSHRDAAFIHQHVVDAQAAQTATAKSKPIGIAFALAGLYLHLEHGFTGRQVQQAHMALARRKHDWPRFDLPKEFATLTASDVLRAPEGPLRDRAIDDWCKAVWRSWQHAHEQGANWIEKELQVKPRPLWPHQRKP